MLCQLLDPADPMGRDWCLLAVQLEMTDKVPKLDGGSSHESKKVCSQTARVLDEWEQNASSTIGKFISNFFLRSSINKKNTWWNCIWWCFLSVIVI